MKTLTVVTCLCLAGASLSAQNYLLLPASTDTTLDLNGYDGRGLPFMAQNCHVQMFFDATETGSPGFVADELSLRYDGPIPQVGAPGPFTIGRLVIRVGATAITAPTADFAANLTQPLTTVFDGPWTFLPDPGSAFPHPWGGPSDSLRFVFQVPAVVVIPTGGMLAIEMTVENSNMTFAHAILDGASNTGGPSNGGATVFGQGCEAAPGQPPASISVSGLYSPGTAHHLNATGLGANSLAVCVFGVDPTQSGGVPLPATLPGTTCTVYTDPIFLNPLLTDATGAITGVQPAATLSMPADPAFSGLAVYEQFLSLVPTANPWGLVLSNAAQVNLGSWNPPGRGTWSVSHDTSATAGYANGVSSFGYAVRLRTL